MIKDQNGNSVQIGSSILTNDASGTQKTSPFSMSGGIDSFVVPANAVEFIVNPTTNDMKVSEKSSLSQYDTVGKGTKESIPCARMTTIYVEGSASDNLNFRFTTL